MASSFDIDLYNWLLVDVLQLQSSQISGDPVNDAVYLVLLPMVILYLFVNYVVGNSRFKGKFEYIIMFVMGFFIVREGYYSLFAGFALPLLIILMLLYSLGFIFGGTRKEDSKKAGLRSGGVGGGAGGVWNNLKLGAFHPINNAYDKAMNDLSHASWTPEAVRDKTNKLIRRWNHLQSSLSTLSLNGSESAQDEQEIIEQQLADLATLNTKFNVLDALSNNATLKENVELSMKYEQKMK